jgi:uncharacterized RDD family membrane protein YckC
MQNLPSPYAPPRSDTYVPEPVDALLVDASQGTRFANFFLDGFGRTFFAIAAMMPFALLKLETLGMVALFLSLPGYYFVFEATLGRTPAKFLTGTRVVSMDGSRPSTGQILGRSLARFVPFEPFSFFGSSRGWHDSWSRTRVVKN